MADRAKGTLPSVERNERSQFPPKQPDARKDKESVSSTIQSILDDTDSRKGYKVVTEEEFALIETLNERESELMQHIKRNEQKLQHSKQQIREIERAMEHKMRDLISTLQREVEGTAKRMKDEVMNVETQIDHETKNILKTLKQCHWLSQQIKSNISKPVQSWKELKTRSLELLKDTQRLSLSASTTMKSVENIQIRSDINWDGVVENFRKHIQENIHIMVQFETISLPGNAQQKQPEELSNDGLSGKSETVISDESEDSRSDTVRSKFAIQEVGTANPVEAVKMEQEQELEENEEQEAEDRAPIDVFMVCFTKESNVHSFNMSLDIEGEVGVNDAVWAFAPNQDEVGSEDKSEALDVATNEHHHRVKYPSMIHHRPTDDIYRFGGVMDGKQLHDSERYNLAKNQWTKLKPAPIARQDAVSLVLNDGNIITMGGAAKVTKDEAVKEWTFYDDISVYNITNDSWSSSNVSGDSLCGMNEARYGFCGLRIPRNNKVIVFGGNSANGRSKTVELFDFDEKKCIYLKDLPTAKSRHAAVWYNEHVIIAGGDAKSKSKECFLYDLQSSEWNVLPSLNEEHDRPIIKAYEDKSCVIVFGHGLQLKSFEILDERMDEHTWMVSNIKNHPIHIEFKAGMIAI